MRSALSFFLILLGTILFTRQAGAAVSFLSPVSASTLQCSHFFGVSKADIFPSGKRLSKLVEPPPPLLFLISTFAEPGPPDIIYFVQDGRSLPVRSPRARDHLSGLSPPLIVRS